MSPGRSVTNVSHPDRTVRLMIRAAIYVRISEDPRDTRLGVARQEKDCREVCDRNGWTVADVYVDNDISAADPRKVRPAYRRMLDDIKAGLVDAVVAWDQDRLVRQPIELEEFFGVCDAAGVARFATVGGEVDLSTGEGVLVARIKGAVAADEIAKLRRRVRRKARELAEAGQVGGGGTRPFGYDDDRVTVRPEEAAVVRELVERVTAGETLTSLARDLTARGVTTPTGREWRLGTLRRMLLAPRIAGLREHRGEIVAEAVWPALVDRTSWERCRRVLTDPGRQAGGTPRRYLLTGIAVCGRCGAKVVARPREDHAKKYVCARGPGFSGCGRLGRLADPLEAWVGDLAVAHLASSEFAVRRQGRSEQVPVDAVLTELGEVEERMRLLSVDFADGAVSRAEWLAARDRLAARQDALSAALDRARARDVLAGLPSGRKALREAWDGMVFGRRRAILEALVDRVTLLPAVKGYNRFDPSKVEVSWRA